MAHFSRFTAFAVILGPMILSGCGGGTSVTYPQNVSISMTPTVPSLAVGTTQQFTATVTNYTAAATWNLQPNTVPAGTITQTGLYTAPSVPPAVNYGGVVGQQGAVTVTASVSFPSAAHLLFGDSVSTSETFVVTAPTVTVGFFPSSATVALGGTVKFQPYAVGSLNSAYTLQVNGVTGGSMSYGTIVQDKTYAGLYTAPTVMPMTGNTVTITVISAADPTKTATATVTLQ